MSNDAFFEDSINTLIAFFEGNSLEEIQLKLEKKPNYVSSRLWDLKTIAETGQVLSDHFKSKILNCNWKDRESGVAHFKNNLAVMDIIAQSETREEIRNNIYSLISRRNEDANVKSKGNSFKSLESLLDRNSEWSLADFINELKEKIESYPNLFSDILKKRIREL